MREIVIKKYFQKYFLLTFIITNLAICFSSNCMVDPTCCSSNTCSTCTACNDTNCCTLGKCDGYPFLLPRSQGRNAARELVGWQQFINRYDMDSTYGAFSMTAEYSQSFRPERLTNFLFGSDLVDCNCLYIQGSQVANRNSKSWLADYFGLPTDFESKLSFSPKVQNFIYDINFYLGLDELASGLFFRIDFPLAWTKWQLCPCEQVVAKGANNYSAGYMSTTTIQRSELANSFLQTMQNGYTFGDMKSPIKAGKFINNCCSKTSLAQINMELGWNFLLAENYHFGLGFYAAVPTGTTPSATYLFEPIVGNGKHWEFGAALTGSWIFHRSAKYPDRYFGIWYDAIIAHQFNSCQCRSFDFCGKPNSRYMLLEEMSTNINDIKADVNNNETSAAVQYARNLIPAINWATFSVDVRVDVMADAVIKMGCIFDNWTFDLGYNFWAKSGERFCNDKCVNDNTRFYAIKGDATIYGAINNGNGTIYPLSASENKATIRTGTNYPSVNGDIPATNPRIDNAYLAQVGTNSDDLYVIGQSNQVKTSVNPVIVSKKNLNLGNGPSSLTNKIFCNIGYTWKEKEGDYVPFLGLGGEVELATDNYDSCCCCNNSCKGNIINLEDSIESEMNRKINTDIMQNEQNINSVKNSQETKNSNNLEENSDITKGCCDSQATTCCNTCCSCDCPRGGISNWGAWIKGGIAFD